jgi:hypothetical protein
VYLVVCAVYCALALAGFNQTWNSILAVVWLVVAGWAYTLSKRRGR